MKTYFIQLTNYDRYANLLLLETLIKTGETEKAVELLAHLLSAQQVWLSRLEGKPVTGHVLWPDWKPGIFKQLINDNYQRLINFLDYSAPDDFDKTISYTDLKGSSHENKLSDILAHYFNHGTHHRAQAGQHLKLAGADLPNTDYIFYLRQ